MSQKEFYDTALLGILQNEGQIQPFLDVIFAFLYRKTDFFRIMLHQKDKYGFNPGVAEKLVLSSFKKFEKMAESKNRELRLMFEKSQNNTIEQTSTSKEISKSTEVKEEEKTKDTKKETHESLPVSKISQIPDNSHLKNKEEISQLNPTTSKTPKIQEKKEEKNEEKEEENAQKIFQTKSESYNGAERENYSWSQSITDLDVYVKVPESIKKSKQLKVELGKKKIGIWMVEKGDEEKILVEGDLCWEVQKEESTWSLVPGKHVHISLEKTKERWWEALVTSEPKINIRKIDASRPITDLDEEAQAKVEEMMYNEEQKRKGLPQSHEKKMADMLRKGWDLEGSPFKGQPFDISNFNFSS